MNNVKQIALSLHSFNDAKHHFPPGTVYVPDIPAEYRLSWLSTMLPYVDQDAVAKRINWQAAWDSDANRDPAGAIIPTYICPAHTGDPSNQTDYVGLSGVGAESGRSRLSFRKMSRTPAFSATIA
jgi:hypothetical protein